MAALALALLLLAFSGTSKLTSLLAKDIFGHVTIISTTFLNMTYKHLPNTVRAHCNYAVNSYFQRKGQGSCDFAGTATVTASDPSSGGTCVYPSSVSLLMVVLNFLLLFIIVIIWGMGHLHRLSICYELLSTKESSL
ncbi:hypothetical protein AAZX31_09G136800 [Glycine max]